ncbi:MAG: hypothetical protein WBE87_05570 [Candidatus Acidiferrales bacterium]
MDAAFANIVFNEPLAAEANLAILQPRLPAALWSALPTLLAQVPSPDDALNFLERFWRAAPQSVVKHVEAHRAALHYLLTLFSYSRFLSESLVQQPELILWLDRRGPREGLERMKSHDDLLEDCYRFSTIAFDLAPAVFLARFKRREYLRITLRDVLNLASLAETSLELSDLADVLIERALRLSAQHLENMYGVPQWSDASGNSQGQLQPARMTVISLGKLGGQELNYSSDIDLMFLYNHDGTTAGGAAGTISNLEYFVRLAQTILKLLTEATPEGAVFRVDMRLRPEGQLGDLAVSLDSALDYYRTRAREWELQMLIKARVSAGEVSTGETFLREVHPLIFRQEFHLAAVEAVLNAREEITRSLRRGNSQGEDYGAAWNVKLTPGGIRDIEFLAQCLQRVHGGRDPWLTSRGSGSTLVALQHLHDKGYLSQRDFFLLGSAYQFLRKVEHRLQLRDGLQEHTLPRKHGALERIARRCGIEAANGRSAGELLLEQTRRYFEEVRAIYMQSLPSAERDAAGSPPTSEQILELRPFGEDALLVRLRTEFPALAARLVHHRAQGDPFARRGVEKFLEAALLDLALLHELQQNPEWLDRAGELFARSDFAAETLIRDPHAIRQIFDAEDQRARALPFQPTMASLRRRQRDEILRVAARSLLGESKPFDTFAALTRIAEESVRSALDLAARDEMPNVKWESAPFVVLALGRLGANEFDISSDADAVFLADPSVSEQEIDSWRRLAERFIHVAGSYTSEGLLLPVDTRLRPRGGEGEIVQGAKYFLEYFSRDAEGWEAATYLKARPVAGNIALGENILGELRDVLRKRFSAAHGGDPAELRRQLVHTRERLERERPESETGFKSCAGGFFDIDYIAAYLKLARGLVAEAPANIVTQISFLGSNGALGSRQAETLRAAAICYRSLDHAIRLALGRPSEQLPEPAQLPRVYALMEQWGVAVHGSLFDAVAGMRRMVRGIYVGIVRGA